MWCLSRLSIVGEEVVANQDNSFWFSAGQTVTVGRKGTDIVVEDKSVSRKHAELTVQPSQDVTNINNQSKLLVKDCSKFGTFLKKERISQQELVDGDQIRFGVSGSWYQVFYKPIVICTSNIDSALKLELLQKISKIGFLVEDFSVSTHLLMKEIRVTPKVLLALVEGIPIVSPNWIDAVLARPITDPSLPPSEKFLPPVVKEPSLDLNEIDYTTIPSRKTIFAGRTFVFLHAKQHAALSDLIERAGGEAVPVFDKKDAKFFAKFENASILEPLSEDTEFIKHNLNVLRSLNFKTVGQHKLGLSILRVDVSLSFAKKNCPFTNY